MKQKEVIGEIDDHLIYYSNYYGNPLHLFKADSESEKEKRRSYDEAAKKIRKFSTLLISNTQKIPFYVFLSKIKIIKLRKNIREAAKNLIGLSNSFFMVPTQHDLPSRNSKRADRIRGLLSLSISN